MGRTIHPADEAASALEAVDRELAALEAEVSAIDTAKREATFGPIEARERARQLRERRRILYAEQLADKTWPGWRARVAELERREEAEQAAYERLASAWVTGELDTVQGRPARLHGQPLLFRPGEPDLDEQLAERRWRQTAAELRRLRSWPMRLLAESELRSRVVAADGTKQIVNRDATGRDRPSIPAGPRNRLLGALRGNGDAA